MNLNPQAQAEEEVKKLLAERGITDPDTRYFLFQIVERALARERMVLQVHPDCGADNPEGLASKCQCHCHKGHFRHYWVPIIKTPVLNEDNTYHLLDRCKYCPDVRFKVIKSDWVGERHTIISQEFLIRGEHRVLTMEEFLTRDPKRFDPQEISKRPRI
jgi:hypothetical protein